MRLTVKIRHWPKQRRYWCSKKAEGVVRRGKRGTSSRMIESAVQSERCWQQPLALYADNCRPLSQHPWRIYWWNSSTTTTGYVLIAPTMVKHRGNTTSNLRRKRHTLMSFTQTTSLVKNLYQSRITSLSLSYANWNNVYESHILNVANIPRQNTKIFGWSSFKTLPRLSFAVFLTYQICF